MECWSWLIIFLVVAFFTIIGAILARIKRDGIGNSSETIHGLPPEMGFRYKNDCNDPDSWTGE